MATRNDSLPRTAPVHAPRVTPGDFSSNRTAGPDEGELVCVRCGWDRQAHQRRNACVEYSDQIDPDLFQRNIASLELQLSGAATSASARRRR